MAAAVLAVALLACVGWGLYTPVYNFVMGLENPFSAPFGGDPSSSVSSVPAESETSSLPAEVPEAPETKASLRAVYLPPDLIGDVARLDSFLASMKNAGVNAVVVDLKDDTGALLYRSQLPEAAAAKAVSASAFDAAALSLRISGAGFTPVARVHAFRDQIMPRSKRDSAVMYMNTDWTWLDNAPDLGGKPWLNPYSQTARDYIGSLVEEIAGLGFKTVLMDSVQFPSGVGLEKAGYGSQAAVVSRQKVLVDFLASLDARLKAKDGKLMVYLPGRLSEADEQNFYGGDRFAIVSQTAVVGMPAGEEIAPLAQAAVSRLSGKTALLLLHLYDQAGGQPLDAAQTVQRISEALQASEDGYVLYHPSGSYNLSPSLPS
jgi:hypothetical protein